MEKIFFDGWDNIVRVSVLTVLGYISMIFLLRISGKRTLSKMNAFDMVITFALGSALATVSLSKKVTLSEGVLAISLLIFMQFIITWLSVRYKSVKKLITNKPTMLLYKGELLWDEMKKQRIAKEEIDVSARKHGFSDLSEIDVIVLETTGELTVIKHVPENMDDSLMPISNFGKEDAFTGTKRKNKNST